MKEQIYLKYFGYRNANNINCEYCGNSGAKICYIGNKENIKDLMALCQICRERADGISRLELPRIPLQKLIEVHNHRIKIA